MAEALTKVKRRLGREAVILNTRTFTRGGFLGHGSEQVVEITAAKDGFSLQSPPRLDRVRNRSGGIATVEGAAKVRPEVGRELSGADDTLLTLKGEISDLRTAIAGLVTETRRGRDPSLPGELREVYQELLEAQVADEIATDLVQKVRSELPDKDRVTPSAVRSRLAVHVESMLPLVAPQQQVAGTGPLVIALVGPTGTGKTTTVAKLAANYRLRDGHQVGLITLDSYRIAAVDQLRTYARIIDVPLEIVMTPDQMGAALRSMSQCNVILIDTVGSSQNDVSRLQWVKDLLDEAHPDEVHLVLSSTGSTPVLKQTMDRFRLLGVNRVIFTKLDEAVGFGVILSCLQNAEAKLSYVTTGQEVPDDIEVVRPDRLAQLIVTGRWGGSVVQEDRQAASVE